MLHLRGKVSVIKEGRERRGRGEGERGRRRGEGADKRIPIPKPTKIPYLFSPQNRVGEVAQGFHGVG